MIEFAEQPEEKSPEFSTMEENISRILNLDAEIESLETRLDKVKARRSEVERALLLQFAEGGIQNIKAQGRTVYLHRTFGVQIPAETMSKLVEVLDDNGAGSVAPRGVHAASIKALLKEDEEKWKEKLGELVMVRELFFIRSRKSSK